MFDSNIEALANRVRDLASSNPPVDLDAIAKYDGIILVPVANHENFNGKIEFLADVNTFIIFHPDPATYRYPNRLRFSIAHELGHYYIDEHRAAIVRGESHSSLPGFKSKDPREVQADEFAAALLIPATAIEAAIAERGFLTLEQIDALARKWSVSLYATTIRYVRMASEICGVALAHNGRILSYVPSDDARFKGFARLAITTLPQISPRPSKKNPDHIEEYEFDAETWFHRAREIPVWENRAILGEGYTLSLIAPEVAD